MKLPREFWLGAILFISYCCLLNPAWAQEKIRLAHSALESSNAVWYLAQDRGFYKKHGLDADLLFIPSTTTSVSSLVAGDVQVANASGGGVASAVVAGADLVLVSCYLNSLPYELVVGESVKSAEDLKGKSLGISRLGSASDVAVRALIRGLGLEPDKQVLIMQVGGPAERAASFRTGRIAGFPSPPGIIHLTKGMPFQDSHQHRRFSEAVRISLYLRHHHEELSFAPERNGEKSSDGAHRGGSIFQEPQGRDQKNHLQIQ